MANPGVTTVDLIVAEAKRRGIVVHNFSETGSSLKQFEYKGHRELVYYSASNMLGHVTFKVFFHKGLTSALLAKGGFRTPTEITAHTIEEAEAFLEKHKQVVVKPFQNTGGKGVTPGITTKEQLAAAFTLAEEVNAERPNKLSGVVCQQHVEGRDFRLLVMNQEKVYGIERIQASVTGDGVHTVSQLVDMRNSEFPEAYHIQLNDQALELLAEQELTVDSVVDAGTSVQLARVANAHAGGSLRDVTDIVCDEAKQTAIAVAKYFDVPVVGVDVLSNDISSDPGVIIELNSTPDFTIHHYPDEGSVQHPTVDFVDALFPETRKTA